MTPSSQRRIFRSLTLRMFVPVVLVICAVGFGLYFFVLRAVSEFADQKIRETLTLTAKEIYGICDHNFTELMRSGRMNDSKALRIKRALTLGAIEDFAKRHNLGLVLYEKGNRRILVSNVNRAMIEEMDGMDPDGATQTFRFNGNRYYFHHFDFRPWAWHFELVNDTTLYAPLIKRVKRLYNLTAGVLLVGLALLLFALEHALRSPVRRIINALRQKRPPDYRGIREFEFLSNNIAGMMASLKERTAWLERLYRVGSANRGQGFFKAVSRVIADAMGLCVVITQKSTDGERFSIVTAADTGDLPSSLEDLDGGLPCERIADSKEPVIVPRRAARHLSSFKGIVACSAESYIGLPIFGREGGIIGCVHMFGAAKEVDDWDMNFIKTHNANTTAFGHTLIPTALTRFAVYIVRNPLDVVLSYARHFGMSHDKTIYTIAHHGNTTLTARE